MIEGSETRSIQGGGGVLGTETSIIDTSSVLGGEHQLQGQVPLVDWSTGDWRRRYCSFEKDDSGDDWVGQSSVSFEDTKSTVPVNICKYVNNCKIYVNKCKYLLLFPLLVVPLPHQFG